MTICVENSWPSLAIILVGLAAPAAHGAVGSTTVECAPGLTILANPLRSSDDHTWALLRGVAEGTALYKWGGDAFTTNLFAKGQWQNTNEMLAAGEGALFYNPAESATKVVFVGRILTGQLTNPVPPGLSLRSSLVPRRGLVTTDLKLRLGMFDNVLKFRGTQYAVFTSLADGNWFPAEPEFALGEAFFINSAKGTNWVVTFNLGPSAMRSEVPATRATAMSANAATVNFANAAAGVTAPVTLGEGGARVEGPDWRAQLLRVKDDQTLQAVGEPVLFQTGTLAGYFLGDSVAVPELGPGDQATFRVKAFVANGSAETLSEPVRVRLGGGKEPPPNLVGLAPWTVTARPTIVALRAGDEIILTWPREFADFALEATPQLGRPDWQIVAETPIADGLEMRVTVPTAGAARYFRLRH